MRPTVWGLTPAAAATSTCDHRCAWRSRSSGVSLALLPATPGARLDELVRNLPELPGAELPELSQGDEQRFGRASSALPALGAPKPVGHDSRCQRRPGAAPLLGNLIEDGELSRRQEHPDTAVLAAPGVGGRRVTLSRGQELSRVTRHGSRVAAGHGSARRGRA